MDNQEKKNIAEPLIKRMSDIRERASFVMDVLCEIRVSDEMTLAYRSMQMARAWMGKVKGLLGSETPYVPVEEAKDIVTNDDISASKEARNSAIMAMLELGAVPLRNELREKLGDFMDEMVDYEHKFSVKPAAFFRESSMYEYFIKAIHTILAHLQECRFWIGYDLERLKNDYDFELLKEGVVKENSGHYEPVEVAQDKVYEEGSALKEAPGHGGDMTERIMEQKKTWEQIRNKMGEQWPPMTFYNAAEKEGRIINLPLESADRLSRILCRIGINENDSEDDQKKVTELRMAIVAKISELINQV